MKKFTSIRQFRHIHKQVEYDFCYEKESSGEYIYNSKIAKPTLNFTGTVKLHGTNCSIQRNNGIITFYSRSSVLNEGMDHYKFFETFSQIPDHELNALFDKIGSNNEDIQIYGEYIGPGIQKSVAISNLEKRQFVIFSISVNDEYIKNAAEYCLHEYNIYNILEIPLYSIDINFNEPSDALFKIEQIVNEVEQECPWGKKFGILGTGEGIVWTLSNDISNSNYWFKTKGEKHKTKSTKSRKSNKIEIDPIIQESINNFIEYSLTEDRLYQGLNFLKEQNKDINIDNIGFFLKWILSDIYKEENDVLKVSNLEWNCVSRAIAKRSKIWFFSYIDLNL